MAFWYPCDRVKGRRQKTSKKKSILIGWHEGGTKVGQKECEGRS